MKIASALALSALIVLGGCSSIKKLTGQRNDTVLPGQREDVLPPDRQVGQDPAVMGKAKSTAAECTPDDLNCVSPERPADTQAQ
jgi:hypothetical protein